MKQTLTYTFLLSIFLLLASCSKDDDSPSLNETGQKLIGEWSFDDPATQPIPTSSFTFMSDGKVTYRFVTISGNSYDSETGSFSVNGDKLTMVFPETVTLTYVQKIVFLTDKKMQFSSTGNPKEEPWDGIYYKVK